jgi:2-dehydropantoate 2-reductase
MKTLIVGAGGIGGYFGGRLLEAGRDVTFLVRPRRAEQIAKHGLSIRSPFGDFDHPSPRLIQASEIRDPYDLVLLSCKAYDLDDAVHSIVRAVGPDTAIVPALNGMRHLDVLDKRFGAHAVLGGLAMIASTMDDEGRILHLNKVHSIVFGERDGSRSERIVAIEAEMARGKFESRRSDAIVQEMWEKWVFIATGAGITSLMRSTVGDIEAAGGASFARTLLSECADIATATGFPPSQASLERGRATFTEPGSSLTASMYRDIERGGRTEGEHILGDLLRRGHDTSLTPLLHIAYTHVATYEVRRARLETERDRGLPAS